MGLREISRRLIPASKTSPNLPVGPRCLGDKCARRMIGVFQEPAKHRGDHLRGTEGDKSSLRSTSSKTRACEAARWSPWGTEGDNSSLKSTSLKTRACEGSQHPKVVKCRVQPGRRSLEPLSGGGVRVERECVRRSDLYTSHPVNLPRNHM